LIGLKTLQLEAINQIYVNFGKHQIPAPNSYPSQMKANHNKYNSVFTFLLITFLIVVCSFLLFKTDKESGDESIQEFAIIGQSENGFEDGTYCAEVDYYNPNTTTRSTYTLEVEVENNEVVKIYFGNGGWLDSDHMSPEELDSDGHCTIISDRNYEYDLTIIDNNCSSSDVIPEEEDEEDENSEVLFTLEQCAKIYNLSRSELNQYMKSFNVSLNDKYTEEMCQSLGDYIQEVRKLNQKWGKTQSEINNGYITNITRSSAYGITSQVITIKKNGRFYELEVRGSEECTMGTAIFDETNYDWQLVYIKQYPDKESYSGHYMRILQ
jgi:hypothetical protein